MSDIPILIEYSPLTELDATLGVDDTTAKLVDISSVPDLGTDEITHIVLCESERYDSEDPNDYETCKVTNKDAGTSEVVVERGIEGNQKEWPAGTYVRCLGTAEAWNRMRNNVVFGTIPDGGTTGQVLAKASATDYDTEWADVDLSNIQESLRWGAI